MNPVLALATTLGVRPAISARDSLPCGIPPVDRLIHGFPRGAISEIAGPESSGRATLSHALLAASTHNQEIAAYIDTNDSFDPQSAAAAGIELKQLLWIRCGHNLEHAFKAADLILHAGGFGVVLLDLSRAPDHHLRRIPLSYWYRFRRAIENTPTILTVTGREPQAKSCASLILELTRKQAVWTGAPGFHLLREVQIEAGSRKPVRPGSAAFRAIA